MARSRVFIIKLALICLLGISLLGSCAGQSPQLKTQETPKPFVGAGVLPYAVYQGEIFVLLGLDDDDTVWTDFGGSIEKVSSLANPKARWETRIETAARECHEETRGFLGYVEVMQAIDGRRFYDHPTIPFRTYTIKISHFPEQKIRDILVPLGEEWSMKREKEDFYWISLGELAQIIENAVDRSHVILENAPGKRKKLRPELFDSWRVLIENKQLYGLFP